MAIVMAAAATTSRADAPASRELPTVAIRTPHPISPPGGSIRGPGASSGGSLFGVSAAALALGGLGAGSLVLKKWRPSPESGTLRVVGRVALSPKQAVYLLKAGDRILILGTGGQGPPALLGEMPAEAAAPGPGGVS